MPSSSCWTRSIVAARLLAAPSAFGNASTRLVEPLRQSGRRHRAEDRPASPAASQRRRGFAPCSTRTTNGLYHARRDARVLERGPAVDRVAGAGQVLRLRLARVQVQPAVDERADDREADQRDRHRPADDEVGPAAPEALLRVPAVEEALRQQAHAVHAGAERREQGGQQRDRGGHRHDRDQHPADPDRADERQRQDRPSRAGRRATVVPDTITERPACVIVSTIAVSTSSPSRSSSRKRKIISSA